MERILKLKLIWLGLFLLAFSGSGIADPGYSCGACYLDQATGYYFYDVYFQGQFYQQVRVAWTTPGQCGASRFEDTRCASAVPPPPPPPPPPTPTDECFNYTGLGVSACMNHPGCNWSLDSSQCYIKSGMPCPYYTIHGVTACMQSSDSCAWSLDARQCYQK